MVRSHPSWLVLALLWCSSVAVTAVDVSLFPPCESKPIPPIAGYVSQNNLVLDAGCRYNLYEKKNAANCFQGNWIVIAGSSNTLLEFNNLINFLAPSEFDKQRNGKLIGIAAMVDAIVENGEVTHWEEMPNIEPACRQKNISIAKDLEPHCKKKMGELLSKAPKHSDNAIRITFVTAFFWFRSDLTMEVVDQDHKWRAGKLGFVTQIGAWYFYCCQLKFSYCPRKELLELDMSGNGMDRFKDEMERSLEKMQSWCQSGRVQLGCYLQTISWSDGEGERNIYADMNVHITQAMKHRATSQFKLIDFYRMGGNMPEEVHGGHGSIMLNLWMWTVMFNSMCPAELAADNTNAVFDGVMCSGTQLRWANCPKYHHFCTHGGPQCEKWECMNSVKCTLSASSPPNMGDTAGLCDAPIDISGFAESKKSNRVWTHQDIQWVLPVVVSVLALLLKLLLVHCEGEGKSDEDAVKKEVHQAQEYLSTQQPNSPYESAQKPNSPSGRDVEGDPENGSNHSRLPLLDGGLSKEPTKEISLPVAGHKYPLGLARFMASSHVVMGHLFARGVIQPLYFFGWGFTWVPWFFMLSGFVLFSGYLKRPKDETNIGYVLRRSGTIYPLYAFALLLAFILGKVKGHMYTELPTLIAQSFLVQAWVPYFTENSLQMHCWFLSCMVVYWFFFPPISKAMKDIDLMQTCSLMSLFFFLPWLLILIPLFTNEEVDWYKEHDFYQTDTYLDLGVVVLKYNPICYFHVFLLGMLLAKLRQLLDIHAKSSPHGCFSWRNPYNVVLQLIAPLGYAGVLTVFSDENFNAKAWGYKLSARVSVLLPFQAMILFGLAGLPSLPFPFLSYAFSMMDFLENYSYAVYVFQFLLYAFWPQEGHVNLLLFLIYLYASAYIIGNCIQQPLQKWWAAHPKGQLAVPFLLAGIFTAGCYWHLELHSSQALSDLPDVIRINDDTVDMKLGLQDESGKKEGCEIINPSFLWRDHEVVVVARRHCRETRQKNGWYDPPQGYKVKAVIIEQVWHSEILMGSQPFENPSLAKSMMDHWPKSNVSLFNNLSLQSWKGLSTSDGSAWRDLCVSERWIPSNRTLMRLVVTGPEDPKIVPSGNGFDIAFDSQPPKSTHPCRTNTKGMLDSVPQMYFAPKVESTNRWRPTRAERLSYGSFDVAEKNWIPFEYKGETYFVYTPVPHVIVSSNVGDEGSKMLYSTTYHPLHLLREKWPQVQIRGSAQATLVQGTRRMPRPHYLALLHLFDTDTKRYAHHAYRFQHEPPFMILQVSSQLPLSETAATPNGVPFAFASGLAVEGDTVVVTYGAGDRESRALVITLNKLDEFFQCG